MQPEFITLKLVEEKHGIRETSKQMNKQIFFNQVKNSKKVGNKLGQIESKESDGRNKFMYISNYK